jgi:hypothetical protein
MKSSTIIRGPQKENRNERFAISLGMVGSYVHASWNQETEYENKTDRFAYVVCFNRFHVRIQWSTSFLGGYPLLSGPNKK